MGARILSGETVRLGRARPEDLAVGDVVAFVDTSGRVVALAVVVALRLARSVGRP